MYSDVSPNSCAKSINDFAISAIFIGSIRCSFTSFQAESRGGHFVCVKTDFLKFDFFIFKTTMGKVPVLFFVDTLQ